MQLDVFDCRDAQSIKSDHSAHNVFGPFQLDTWSKEKASKPRSFSASGYARGDQQNTRTRSHLLARGLAGAPFMRSPWVQQRLSRLVAAVALIGAASALQAAEAGIGVDTASHQHSDFQAGEEVSDARRDKMIALLPRSRAGGQAWVVHGQTVTITRNRQGGVNTASIADQCAWFGNGTAAYIACAEEPRNALAGVVYRRAGKRGDGEDRYGCARRCSPAVPKSMGSYSQPEGS